MKLHQVLVIVAVALAPLPFVLGQHNNLRAEFPGAVEETDTTRALQEVDLPPDPADFDELAQDHEGEDPDLHNDGYPELHNDGEPESRRLATVSGGKVHRNRCVPGHNDWGTLKPKTKHECYKFCQEQPSCLTADYLASTKSCYPSKAGCYKSKSCTGYDMWVKELDLGPFSASVQACPTTQASSKSVSSSPSLIAKGQYCQNHKALGAHKHGFGFTLESCAAETAKTKGCTEYFYYSQSHKGQCKCATDNCSDRRSYPIFNVYKVQQPSLIAKGQYCQNHKALGPHKHGFGFTLESCAAETAKTKGCTEYFYYSQSHKGQCKCATDNCSDRRSSAFHNVYLKGGGFVTAKILHSNTHLFKGSNAAIVASVYKDKERRNEILRRSKKGHFDLLSFTEVWAEKWQDYFKSQLQGQSYAPRADASGLAALVGGSPGMVFSTGGGGFTYGPYFDHYANMADDDKYAFKGVSYGVALVQGTLVGWVQTHAQADYEGEEHITAPSRKKQIKETLFPAMRNIKNHLNGKGPTILLGDLNILGTSDEYTWFKTEVLKMGFKDCWTETNPGKPGYTYDPLSNKLVKRFDKKQTKQQRLDYVFMSPGNDGDYCVSMRVLNDWKLADGTPVSDHEGMEVVIKYQGTAAAQKAALKGQCSDDRQCASGNCFTHEDVCQCNECSTSGCGGCPSGHRCWNLNNYEPNECIPLNTKRDNGQRCDNSGQCKSKCCSWTAQGANTCENDKMWRNCT